MSWNMNLTTQLVNVILFCLLKTARGCTRRPSYVNQGFAPLTGSNGSDVEDVLSKQNLISSQNKLHPSGWCWFAVFRSGNLQFALLISFFFLFFLNSDASILSAPLQTVLDNLDVLEELVILLDPESHGRKNTKHLASHCTFPATWITYIYSMKDSKSPLKAVLEGVTCKYPDWTVGHLAKLFKLMERNDAIATLAKLKVNKTDV